MMLHPPKRTPVNPPHKPAGVARALARRWGAACLLGGALWVSGAGAEEKESAEDRKVAAKAFAEGQKAFTAGDFRHAAESFDQAYKRAPRLPALWNAARAWHRAGEPVRAANLYARYLKEAPPSAPDRASALAAMKDLESKLARLEIHADGFTEVTVDGSKIEDTTVYVSPGEHLVEGKIKKKAATERPKAEAGVSTSVVLTEPKSEPPPTPPPPPPPPPAAKGIAPIYAVVSAGLTVVAGGVTLWSGLDTLKQKDTFDGRPTQRNLDEGHTRQARTNALLGVTGGLLATTVILGVVTNWQGLTSGQMGLSPGGLFVRGTF